MSILELNPAFIEINKAVWSYDVPKIGAKKHYGCITLTELNKHLPADILGYILNNILNPDCRYFLVVPQESLVYDVSPRNNKYLVRSFDFKTFFSAIMPWVENDFCGHSLNPYYDAIIDEAEALTGKETVILAKPKESPLFCVQRNIYKVYQLSEEDRLVKYGTDGLITIESCFMDMLVELDIIDLTFPTQKIKVDSFKDTLLFLDGLVTVATNNLIPLVKQGYFITDQQ